MIGKKAIEEVVEELPFVNINGEIVEDNSIKRYGKSASIPYIHLRLKTANLYISSILL